MPRLMPVIRDFSADRRGSTAIIFGLTAIPLFLFAGSVTDYTGAAQLRARMQVAVDSAALAANRSMETMNDTDLTNYAKGVFTASMAADPRVTVSDVIIDRPKGEVRVTGTGNFDTRIMTIAGFTQIPISATSLSIGSRTYEVAMVLDNSGSMASSGGGTTKIQGAKDAANQLINVVFGTQAVAGATKMSLVPFTISVNAGTAYANASWVDLNAQSSIHWQNFEASNRPANRFAVFKMMKNTNWGGCFESRPYPYNVQESPPSSSDPDSLFVPMFAPDEPGPAASAGTKYYLNTGTSSGSGTNYTYQNSYIDDKGTGCTTALATTDITGRQQRFCKYNGATPSKTSGPNWNCDAKPLVRMTETKSVLTTAVGNMVASGNTNLLEALTWGWRTLSPNPPFSDGRAYNAPNNLKVIVFMTDGMNRWSSQSASSNKSNYSPFGYYGSNRLNAVITNDTNSTDAMDLRTKEACTNAKNAGILIYTVGFSVPADPIDAKGMSVLQSCATNADMAFVANNSSDLVAIFDQIARNITSLRIKG